MGFFDKLTNRVEYGLDSLISSLTESNLEKEQVKMRTAVREGLLRLAVYAGGGGDLSWIEAPELGADLSRDLTFQGAKLRTHGVFYNAPGAIPDAAEIANQLASSGGGSDEILQRFADEVDPHVQCFIATADRCPIAEMVVPRAVAGVVSALAEELKGYPKRIEELQRLAAEKRGEMERTEKEYLEMGETISEELTRHGRVVSGAAGKQLDILSGKEVLAAVQARLDLQSRYNDVLATKLEEALQRIERLESRASESGDGEH